MSPMNDLPLHCTKSKGQNQFSPSLTLQAAHLLFLSERPPSLGPQSATLLVSFLFLMSCSSSASFPTLNVEELRVSPWPSPLLTLPLGDLIQSQGLKSKFGICQDIDGISSPNHSLLSTNVTNLTIQWDT